MRIRISHSALNVSDFVEVGEAGIAVVHAIGISLQFNLRSDDVVGRVSDGTALRAGELHIAVHVRKPLACSIIPSGCRGHSAIASNCDKCSRELGVGQRLSEFAVVVFIMRALPFDIPSLTGPGGETPRFLIRPRQFPRAAPARLQAVLSC